MGHAFHVGFLNALQTAFGWDARQAEVIVGTSAGSVVGAGLRSGLGADDMRRRTLGEPLSAPGAEIVRRCRRRGRRGEPSGATVPGEGAHDRVAGAAAPGPP